MNFKWFLKNLSYLYRRSNAWQFISIIRFFGKNTIPICFLKSEYHFTRLIIRLQYLFVLHLQPNSYISMICKMLQKLCFFFEKSSIRKVGSKCIFDQKLLKGHKREKNEKSLPNRPRTNPKSFVRVLIKIHI